MLISYILDKGLSRVVPHQIHSTRPVQQPNFGIIRIKRWQLVHVVERFGCGIGQIWIFAGFQCLRDA